IADRPEASIVAAAALNDANTDEERAAARKKLVDAGVLASRQRAFVGKNADGDARLVLSDGDGQPRLALSVARSGAAKIEFLDARARRLVPGAESLDAMRRPADLLFALASRRRLRRLARLQTARGKLPRLTIDWRSILPDHHHASIVLDRNQHDARRMADDLD